MCSLIIENICNIVAYAKKGSVAVYLLIILQISQEVIINKQPQRDRKRTRDLSTRNEKS